MVSIVAIDDDPDVLRFIVHVLEGPRIRVSASEDPERGWDSIVKVHPDIVILDQNMPGISGMDLLARIAEWDPAVEVILLTASYDTDLAVAAIRQGAADFLTKPISPEALRARLEPCVEAAERRQRAQFLEGQLLSETRFGDMIGSSAPMMEVFALVRRIAPHFRAVLITGPTGSGKELVARALHRMSPLSGKPLVVCNCAAIVETLFESELFGHVKGSFPGATMDRAGMFEAADGGVLFLDEIGEVPLRSQAKFLRALQNGDVQRVGSNLVRKVNVRVIAATNRDLRSMVKEKEYREDLYYRIAMLEIPVPELAARRDDIPLLARHFVERFSNQMNKKVRGLTRRAQTVLCRYPWPGNVRELENALGHACTMTDTDMIDVADLPARIRTGERTDESPARMTLAEVEKQHILRVYLETAGRNKQLASEILGISRATLYRYLNEYGIESQQLAAGQS